MLSHVRFREVGQDRHQDRAEEKEAHLPILLCVVRDQDRLVRMIRDANERKNQYLAPDQGLINQDLQQDVLSQDRDLNQETKVNQGLDPDLDLLVSKQMKKMVRTTESRNQDQEQGLRVQIIRMYKLKRKQF